MCINIRMLYRADRIINTMLSAFLLQAGAMPIYDAYSMCTEVSIFHATTQQCTCIHFL